MKERYSWSFPKGLEALKVSKPMVGILMVV
jgi:hypothetical protein